MEGAPNRVEGGLQRAENVESLAVWRELKERAFEDAAAELEERTGFDIGADASPEKIAALKEAFDQMSEVDPDTGYALHNELRFTAKEITDQLAVDQEQLAAEADAARQAHYAAGLREFERQMGVPMRSPEDTRSPVRERRVA